MMDVVIIEYTFTLHLIVSMGAFSICGLFLTQLGVAIIDKWGGKNLNIFYRLRAEEVEIKILDIEDSIKQNKIQHDNIEQILKEIKKQIDTLNEKK